MKIVICDDSKDDLEQTLPECLDDILREDDIIYIETSRHKNVFYTAGGGKHTASTRRWMSWRRNWRGWASCGYTRVSLST